MKKRVIQLLAGVCVILAFIGIVVPLLPTTPFLLLAISLYMNSSKSGVKMILKNKYLAPYVRSYFSRKGIPTKLLLRTLLLLWICLFLGIYLNRSNLFVVVILGIIGILVTLHLYLKKEKVK